MNIKAKSISLSYENHNALKDLTFELGGNKIYGLLGKTGLGKLHFYPSLHHSVNQQTDQLRLTEKYH